MTHAHLALESVSLVLPDGRPLFSGLTEQFDARPTGLVGRNGVGKSMLARIMAGELAPTSGRCVRQGTVHHLAQQVSLRDHPTVAALAGVQPVLDALQRIEAGGTDPADFDAVAERWDIRQRLQDELARHGLAHLDIGRPTADLSGGEAMRVALVGAFLSRADSLILDEPTNHLDRPNRHALMEQLQRWPNGLVVVSHDRVLLERMDRIVELSTQGLRSYGGGYAFYAEQKAHERESALQQFEQRKLERRREEQSLRDQRERLERRQARGNRQGREANQAPILLGRQKERSESSAGKLRAQQDAAQAQLSQRVREAAAQVEREASILIHLPGTEPLAQRRVVELDEVELPFVPAATRKLSLNLVGPRRVGVTGPNGCGKSTLLKLLAGQIQPMAGQALVRVRASYLDQQVADLEPERSVLEQMQAVNQASPEGDLRMRLAQLDLGADKITLPSEALSGGERLKAALARMLYADQPAQLLLLDEPGNHLDLASVEALESMLLQYRGALLVVSHDDVFLDRLALTERLQATPRGWRLEPW